MTDADIKKKEKKNQPNKLQACDQHFSQREFNRIASTVELRCRGERSWIILAHESAWNCLKKKLIRDDFSFKKEAEEESEMNESFHRQSAELVPQLAVHNVNATGLAALDFITLSTHFKVWAVAKKKGKKGLLYVSHKAEGEFGCRPVTWNAVIAGCAAHQMCSNRGFMQSTSPESDSPAHIWIIYSDARRLNKGPWFIPGDTRFDGLFVG